MLQLKSILRRSKQMNYIKAQNVLPEEVLELIQHYIDGEFLYIPRKSGAHKAWGEKIGTKDCLKQRNMEIFSRYTNGETLAELMKQYHLSEPSIRRIIGQGRKENYLNNS